MKKLLKKIRAKWHRDIADFHFEDKSAIQNLEKSLKDTQASLCNTEKVFLEKLTENGQSLKTELLEVKKEISEMKHVVTPPHQQSKEEEINLFTNRVELEKVFNLLQDRESQKLFWARLHFAKNNDLAPLYKFLMESERRGNPVDIISVFKERKDGRKKKLIMFGTTTTAKQTFLALCKLGVKVDYICMEGEFADFISYEHVLNNYNWLGTSMITVNELVEKHLDAEVFIGDLKSGSAKRYLAKKGFPESHIWNRHTQWELQYLDPEIMKPREHEVYVDGGVLDLQNSMEFIEWCDGKYDAVYAFEPDMDSFNKSQERMKTEPLLNDERIHLLNAALWNKDEKLSFVDGESGSSRLDTTGAFLMEARSIDSVLQGNPVTFIKLDIEGAELKALHGAAQSIKKWKPRLAICIYHKPEDITEIPLYIHGLVPEYKMYIRHYSTCRAETVLYCVCEE